MRTVLAVAVLALIACSFAAAQEVAAAPRFAEAEAEDSAVLATQQSEFEQSLDESQIEDEEADEQEDEEEDEAEDESEAETEEADEESEEEADEEADEESESEDEEESEDESEEEDEEASDEEADEEAEDESEDESEETEFVLAELSDNAVSTGFMEMKAEFKPTESVAAEHMVHSLDSHQLAVAEQEYSMGYAHGHADASVAASAEEEEEAEPALVEADAEAEAEGPVQYVASNGQPYFASYPAHIATVAPYVGAVPMPPQLPTWLPPPPYITPLPAKGSDE